MAKRRTKFEKRLRLDVKRFNQRLRALEKEKITDNSFYRKVLRLALEPYQSTWVSKNGEREFGRKKNEKQKYFTTDSERRIKIRTDLATLSLHEKQQLNYLLKSLLSEKESTVSGYRRAEREKLQKAYERLKQANYDFSKQDVKQLKDIFASEKFKHLFHNAKYNQFYSEEFTFQFSKLKDKSDESIEKLLNEVFEVGTDKS